MNREPAAATTAVCSNCNAEDQWLLHNVRLRGSYRKLCTSCVLKLHPSSFCPTCFSLHDPANPRPSSQSRSILICFKCSSVSHTSCVPPNAPKSPYLCPPCSNPNFKVFYFKTPSNSTSKIQKEGEDPKPNRQIMDQRSAKALLAAAKISASSMSKAAALAKSEAERRVKEAALARKRAKEALEHVALLSARERIKRREVVGEVEVSFSLHKRENLGASKVSGAVNNVGGGRETGFKVQNVVVQMEKNGVISSDGRDEDIGRVVSPPGVVRSLKEQNAGNLNEEKQGSDGVSLSAANNFPGEKLSNGLPSSSSQNLHYNHGAEDDVGPP
ncbi:hypothetical protein Nepgr_001650 [Nepenthes gracilis]|uniref:Uncharacterized protein n=1 Tax=Nepenthes gracilis TaxID=150966 RepID=A0AAD3RXN6_NEPGR|nr:hypothetical protein Nepgr_001650 [Nepenthes gracilis]